MRGHGGPGYEHRPHQTDPDREQPAQHGERHGRNPAEPLGVKGNLRLGEADFLVEDERHAPEKRFPDLEQEDEAEDGGGDREAVLTEEAQQRADDGAAEPDGSAANRAGYGEPGGDPILIFGLGGDAFRRGWLAHEREADGAQYHHDPEHEKGRLPVVLDPRVLEGLGRLQGNDPAQLVSSPPPDDCGGRAGSHRFSFRPANLLDPKGIDGDVLGGGRDGDDEADGDDAGEVGGWLDRAPKDETHQDHGLKGEDPGPPVSDPMRQPGHPEPVDEGRPEEIEGVDAEDEPGPPDGAAAEGRPP